MGFASVTELQEAVNRACVRSGDATFAAEWDRFLTFAMQRVHYGSRGLHPSQALRIRAMEITTTLTFTSGVAALPQDYLDARRMTWTADFNVAPIRYRTPEEFWAYRNRDASGYPGTFTVEAGSIYVSPAASGTATLTYYARFPALGVGEAVTDRTEATVTLRDGTAVTERGVTLNWLISDAPAVIYNAILIEAWSFLRNPEKRDEAFAAYIASLEGLALSDVSSRLSISTLAPRIRGAMISR